MSALRVLILIAVLVLSVSSYSQQKVDVGYWQSQVESDPSAKNYYNLAVALHKSQRQAQALKVYAQGAKLKESRLRPLFLYQIARIFLARNQLEKAKRVIAKISLENLPPKFRSRVLRFREELFLRGSEAPSESEANLPEKPKKWNWLLDLSSGSNSNPQLLTASSSDSPVEDLQNQILSFLRYKALRGFEVSLFNSHQFFADQAEVNTSLNLLNFEFSNTVGEWQLKFTPAYGFDTFAGRPFSQNYLATLEANRKAGRSLWQNLFSYQTFNPELGEYSYLQGESYTLVTQLLQKWRAWTFLIAVGGDRFLNDDLNSFRSSYDSANLSVGLFWASTRWSFELQSLTQWRAYQQGADEVAERSDRLSQSNLQVGYKWGADFEIYQRSTFIHNDSTYKESDDVRGYQQWQFVLGLNWQMR